MAGNPTRATLTSHPTNRRSASSPSPTSTAAWSKLTDLVRSTWQTQASLARQTVGLTWATVTGDLDRTSAAKAYAVSSARECAHFWRAAGELAVDYAAALSDLRNDVSATVLRETAAAGSSRTRAGVGDHEPSGRWVELSLRASVGGRAEGPVTVTNTHPRPRRILFRAGELVDSAGALVIATPEFTPTTVTVPSGQERSVKLGIDLDNESFLPGERYSCMVEASGGDDAMIAVTLVVDP